MPSLTLTLFFNFLLIPISNSLRNPAPIYDDILHCKETCGGFEPHFPFYINKASCGWSKPYPSASNTSQFQLMCVNSSTLYLSIGTQVYRVLEFYSDGILVDFPGFSTLCRPYNGLNSFVFHGDNPYFGISSDNVVGLYDCQDSSLCKANCEGIDLPGCDNNAGIRPSCCYPLSDHSFWSVGDEFSVFEKYECRGFSSWAVPKEMNSGRRGVKLDWAVPENLSRDACHVNAHIVNSTTVKDGIRCVCDYGFSGDGFKNGTGCFKSCLRDGKDCDTGRHDSKRKIIILAGLFTSVVAAASLTAFICLLKQSYGKPSANNTLKSSFWACCRGRMFCIGELEQATNGFSAELKLADLYNGSVYLGLLEDGTRVAVHRVDCENEKDLTQFLAQMELLSTIVHRHIAGILGCCVDSGYTPMAVYEFPENGTLAEHIHAHAALDWQKRLGIAAETASALAFLENEMPTPVYHHNLSTCCVFLDGELSAKLACFQLISQRSDVYDLGVVLLEILSGSRHEQAAVVALEKIRDGKVEEIVDLALEYHEQGALRKEQMVVMADVATRCLLFGGAVQGALRMGDVARDLARVVKDGGSVKGPTLEETFSNSSLLQMISMSPDSIYAPSRK